MHKKTVWIAGSTQYTADCATALINSADFAVTACLTPIPKPIGREHTITPNPVHALATEQKIATILISSKITTEIRSILEELPPPDLLLVVDFGYLVPEWLLALPHIAAVNIHPSLLPRWRGSSPGQFTLLYGETKSAITVMCMSAGLDEGPLITQLPLAVDQKWNAKEYYSAAFAQITAVLPKLLTQFIENPQKVTPQPTESPTPIAARLSKEDGFVSWELLQQAQQGELTSPFITKTDHCSALVAAAFPSAGTLATLFERACRAFSPWPGLWTVVPTNHGPKRMKVLACKTQDTALEIEQVQIEGKNIARFSEIKNILSV